MTDARPQDLAADPEPEPDAPDIEVIGTDPEVPAADAWEQALHADPGRRTEPRRPPLGDDVPAADAWEQAQPVDVDDDY